MKLYKISTVAFIALILMVSGYAFYQYKQEEKIFLLATTTSVDNTGLLDMLIVHFNKEFDYDVQVTAVGTGAALALGYDGEADALLVHAPDLENEFVSSEYGINHTTLWYNHFVIVGPSSDPANVSLASSPTDAFVRIFNTAEQGLTEFYSRGDNSGTNYMELSIWNNTKLDPAGKDWYKETGEGMSSTLRTTNEADGYTLSDLGTFLSLKEDDGFYLTTLYSEGDELYNPYSYMIVNPEKYPHINTKAAFDFLEFLMRPSTIDLVYNYKASDTVLFTPIGV